MTPRRSSSRSDKEEKRRMLEHYNEKISQVKEMLYLASYNELKYEEIINLYDYLSRVVYHKYRLEKELGYGKKAEDQYTIEKKWIESGEKRLRRARNSEKTS